MNDYYFLGLVLTNLEIEEGVRKAWATSGASGITALDCAGQSLGGTAFTRDDLPLFPSLSSLVSGNNEEQKFLFTIVKGSETLHQMIELTQKVTGNLNLPGRGVLFAWPLATVIGLG